MISNISGGDISSSDKFLINTGYYSYPSIEFEFSRIVDIDPSEHPYGKKTVFQLKKGDWVLLHLQLDANKDNQLSGVHAQITTTICADVYQIVVRKFLEDENTVAGVTVGDEFIITADYLYSVCE